jgi:hypothetical protein
MFATPRKALKAIWDLENKRYLFLKKERKKQIINDVECF